MDGDFSGAKKGAAKWRPNLTTVFNGFFLRCMAILFRQENVNKKYETHPVKSYFTKQLVFISM